MMRPTSSMSGYAQQEGRLRFRVTSGTIVCRLENQLSGEELMSVEARYLRCSDGRSTYCTESTKTMRCFTDQLKGHHDAEGQAEPSSFLLQPMLPARPQWQFSLQRFQHETRGDNSRRRDCHFAAPSSPFSGCFNMDGRGVSAK